MLKNVSLKTLNHIQTGKISIQTEKCVYLGSGPVPNINFFCLFRVGLCSIQKIIRCGQFFKIIQFDEPSSIMEHDFKNLTLCMCLDVLMINKGGTRNLGSAHMIFHPKIITSTCARPYHQQNDKRKTSVFWHVSSKHTNSLQNHITL